MPTRVVASPRGRTKRSGLPMTEKPIAGLLFATTIESADRWINMAALMISSLRRSGGRFSDVPVLLCVAGPTSEARFIGDIPAWRIRVLLAPESTNGYEHAILPLQYATLGMGSLSHLVTLDPDMVVLRLSRLGEHLDERVWARESSKAGIIARLGHDYWRKLPSLDRPWAKVPVFNGGVVIVPAAVSERLAAAWKQWSEKLTSVLGRAGTAQNIAFSAALVEERIEYAPLPGSFNQTCNAPRLRVRPHIVHYHSISPANRDIKERILDSPTFPVDDLAEFLRNPPDLFWRAYADRVLQEVGDPPVHLASEIRALVAPIRA